METYFIYIAIGSAYVISSVYFYCTYKHQRLYRDNEIEEKNKVIRQ